MWRVDIYKKKKKTEVKFFTIAQHIYPLWPSDGDIDSDNGLLPDGTQPLPETMLTYHSRVSATNAILG